MPGPPYNPTAASAAHALLQNAHDDWTARLQDLRPDDDVEGGQADLRLRLYGSAASVLLWARGLDDMCDDPGGHPPYVAVRSGAAPLLSAARYASNHAIHQLIPLSDLDRGGWSYPKSYPLVIRAPTPRWAPESALRPIDDDHNAKLRSVYLNDWAGREMGPTLDALRAWFDQQLT